MGLCVALTSEHKGNPERHSRRKGVTTADALTGTSDSGYICVTTEPHVHLKWISVILCKVLFNKID